MPQLITDMSLVNSAGTEVELMQDPKRVITAASGLSGIISREVVVARSSRSGSRNMTRFRDDSAIVLNGVLLGDDASDTWSEYDTIVRAFADAVNADRLLKWTAGNNLALQRNVRLTSFDAPLTSDGADVITYQATLRASDPNAYDQTLQTATATPLGSVNVGGFTFPRTFPFVYAPPVTTLAAYTNGGLVPTPPAIYLQGYLQDPTIQLSPDVALHFSGEIGGGQYVVVNVQERTVLMNGTENRIDLLVPSTSTWFELPPGSGTVTLLATNFGSGANIIVTWRDART